MIEDQAGWLALQGSANRNIRWIGVSRRTYPIEPAYEECAALRFEITVVLVAGEAGDYAAYIGGGSMEFVARHGDKLSFEEACCHFPGGQLKKELYRA